MLFAKRLKELRLQHGFTQEELGTLLGVTGANCTRYEKGLAQPKITTLIKIAQIFGVSVDYLLGIDEMVAETEEGRKAAAAYWSKLIQPQLDMEYQEGFFYLTALQDLKLDLFDIKKGRKFKLSQKDFELVLEKITEDTNKEIESKKRDLAALYFRCFIETILFQDFVLNEMISDTPTKEVLNNKIKAMYYRHNIYSGDDE